MELYEIALGMHIHVDDFHFSIEILDFIQIGLEEAVGDKPLVMLVEDNVKMVVFVLQLDVVLDSAQQVLDGVLVGGQSLLDVLWQ